MSSRFESTVPERSRPPARPHPRRDAVMLSLASTCWDARSGLAAGAWIDEFIKEVTSLRISLTTRKFRSEVGIHFSVLAKNANSIVPPTVVEVGSCDVTE
jgi:hypothetical protein